MRVPDRKLVAIVYDLRANYPHMSIRDMAAVVGLSSATVGRWLKNESLYHPEIDEVAVARALGGERPVFDGLTVFEQAELLNRIVRLRKSMDDHEWSVWLNGFTEQLSPGDAAERVRLSERFGQAVRRATA